MKSAYELAMERLEKDQPTVKLTEEQREAIADIQNRFDAKVAEKKVFLNDQITKARAERDWEKVETLEKERRAILAQLEADCEAEKEKVRQQRQG